MKNSKKKAFLVAVIFLIPFVLPPLLILILRFFVKITASLKIPPILEFNGLQSIDFSDYMTLATTILSCIITVWLGYITYNLSLSIHNYAVERDKNIQDIKLDLLIKEIRKNANIVKDKENRINDNSDSISFDSYELIKSSYYAFSDGSLKKLSQLYELFRAYRDGVDISEKNKVEWLNEDNSIEVEGLIDEIMKLKG